MHRPTSNGTGFFGSFFSRASLLSLENRMGPVEAAAADSENDAEAETEAARGLPAPLRAVREPLRDAPTAEDARRKPVLDPETDARPAPPALEPRADAAPDQGLTLVHVRAQLEQLQETFMS
jgi:hypothetical protein